MYDVCVIGSGWAGINAAMTAAANKLSVCLVEKNILGGTCLNSGCIPTKSFVTSASHLREARHLDSFGIKTAEILLNFKKVVERKDAVVSRLRQGLEGLIRARKVDLLQKSARFIDSRRVLAGESEIEAKNIIIATGSYPRALPNLKFDAEHILSSADILNLKAIPENLLVIGGGVIGCEFAGIFSELGSKVTIVEILERILITEDNEVSRRIELAFKKKGIKVLTKTDFGALNLDEFDKVLLCVGRAANIYGVGLENAGIKTDKGKICVDEFLRTNINNIYAVGDCIGGYQLAHVAAYEGRIAAENILGRNKKCNYTAVPSCIFTHPEVGSVGLTQDQAKEAGYNAENVKFSFLGLGMAHVKGQTDGFVKLVVNADSEELLGAAILGVGATELIAILALAVRNQLKISDIKETIFPHPALSESIAEAAHNFHAN